MSRPDHPSHATRAGLIAPAAASSMLLLAAAPASAQVTHAPRHQHTAAHVKGHPFTAQGLVVSSTGSSVVVLARNIARGGRVDHDKVITVTVAATHPRHPHGASTAGQATPTLIVGYLVNLSGTATGVGDTATFTATGVVQHSGPTHVFLGTVTEVTTNLVTVTKAATASDDQGENSDSSEQFTIDVTNAAVTVDGAPGPSQWGSPSRSSGKGTTTWSSPRRCMRSRPPPPSSPGTSPR